MGLEIGLKNAYGDFGVTCWKALFTVFNRKLKEGTLYTRTPQTSSTKYYSVLCLVFPTSLKSDFEEERRSDMLQVDKTNTQTHICHICGHRDASS